MPEDDRTQSTAGPQRQPRLLAGRYDVLEVVGSGASAVTWRGHDRRLERQVAIKILRRDGEQDDAYVQRFEREARTSASVSNGHVVDIYDVGQEDGWLYLVMQFVDGEDLKHLIARRGPLPLGEAREIARQILDGLAAIHRAGILHRDIKPQNVLVDRNGLVRVTDFGIAQSVADPGLTMAGVAVGTAAYMAPEQAQAGQLGEATDIYAVGVVLYEMLTGALPFDRPTAMATMLAHVEEQPLPPSRRAPSQRIPAGYDAIVLQAMSKRPDDRFRSATAMARALAGVEEGASVTTRIAPPGGRPNQTRVAPPVPRNQVRPSAVRPAVLQPLAAPASGRSGSGGRGLLNAVLVLILLAMTVVAAFTYYEYTNNRDSSNDTPSGPTGRPGSGDDFQPTDEPPIVGPGNDAEPTDEPEPEPTDELEPSEAPEPTLEPTDVPAEPTEVPIEPADGADPIIGPDGSPGDG